MIEKDLFTITNEDDDYDQHEEPNEKILSKLTNELGFITDEELGETADDLQHDDHAVDCDCVGYDNDFTPLTEYFGKEVLPIELNRKMAEAIHNQKRKESLVPQILDFSKMKNYEIAKYLIKQCINLIRIDGLLYLYCEGNGAYYCLEEPTGRSKFKNELPEEIRMELGNGRIDQVISELLTMHDIESRSFSEGNSNGYLINFKDGVLDIRSGSVYKHSPKYTFIYCLNAYTSDIYAEDNEELFNEYLKNSFGDDTENISNLQEMFGLAISTIRDRKMAFFLHGKSNSGKSVMLDLMKKIVGEEFCSSVSFEQLAARFGTAHFLGKMLNVSGEAPDITAKRLDVFKTIVGNDSIMSERKGKDGFYMRNYALLIFAANNMPEVSIPDEAYYNRLRIIKYNKPVDKSMWINNLPERLYKESLGTILSFAIDGLKRFIDNGMELTYIDTSDRYVNEYRNDANSFISFITQFLMYKSDRILLSKDLFGAYNEYCTQNGLKPIGTNKCSSMLLETFPEAEKTTTGHNGNRCYRGLICMYPKQNGIA